MKWDTVCAYFDSYYKKVLVLELRKYKKKYNKSKIIFVTPPNKEYKLDLKSFLNINKRTSFPSTI